MVGPGDPGRQVKKNGKMLWNPPGPWCNVVAKNRTVEKPTAAKVGIYGAGKNLGTDPPWKVNEPSFDYKTLAFRDILRSSS